VARYIVDPEWRRPTPTTLLAGSPVGFFRVSEAGAAVLDDLEHGRDVADSTLVTRLLDAGAVHPLPGEPVDAASISVVVPAHLRDATDVARLRRLVGALGGVHEVIVVDDGSRVPIPDTGARVMSTLRNSGPSAARNLGLAAVSTSFVAFVDVDVDVTTSDLARLAAYFALDRVGLVAPRILSAPGDGLLERYERVASPLDLGDVEARVRALTRVGHAPSAVWVTRTEAMRGVRGFDEDLRVGEDVDCLWRLDGAGWWCRYAPEVTCRHAPRRDLAELLRQRLAYGHSAAELARRHGGLLTPLRLGVHGVLAALGALIHPILVVFGFLATIGSTSRTLGLGRDESIRLAARVHLSGWRGVATALRRPFLPLTLLLAAVAPRFRRLAVPLLVAGIVGSWWPHRRDLDLPRYAALRVADDAAYSAGVWLGALHARRIEPLTPTLTESDGATPRYGEGR
jgi:mycofactocin system glycosyltransferase